MRRGLNLSVDGVGKEEKKPYSGTLFNARKLKYEFDRGHGNLISFCEVAEPKLTSY